MIVGFQKQLERASSSVQTLSNLAFIMFANAPPAKASHMAKFRFKVLKNRLQTQRGLAFPFYKFAENSIRNVNPWALKGNANFSYNVSVHMREGWID